MKWQGAVPVCLDSSCSSSVLLGHKLSLLLPVTLTDRGNKFLLWGVGWVGFYFFNEPCMSNCSPIVLEGCFSFGLLRHMHFSRQKASKNFHDPFFILPNSNSSSKQVRTF